jgi:hypothetical protein
MTISERLGPTGVVAVAMAPFGLLLVVGGTGAVGGTAGVVLSLLSACRLRGRHGAASVMGGVDPDRTR